MTLQEMIQAMTVGRNIHISVHDLTGLLQRPQLSLRRENRIHTCAFCDGAKATSEGYHICVSHKEKVNALAVRRKKPFWGYCPYGMQELAYPVVSRDRVLCIIYLGKLEPDPEIFRTRVIGTCERSGVNPNTLLELENILEQASAQEYLGVACLLAEYLVREAEKPCLVEKNMHWAVRQAMEYAEHYYENDITISQMGALCGMNAKYLGRLFKTQTGMGFPEYVNKLRMRRAEVLLSEKKSIIEIALACGYSEISYFNRIFRKTYGCSPREYRKKL